MSGSGAKSFQAGSVYEAFRRTTEAGETAPFLHIPAEAACSYGGEALTLSYGEVAEEVDRQRALLADLGVARGQRVALLLDNRAEFFVNWFALNALGASIVPLNAEHSAAEKRFVLEDSGASLVVTLPERSKDLAEIAGALSIPVLRHGERPVFELAGRSAPTDGEECALVYTSGSTGAPKGCMLSNEYMQTMGDWYLDMDGLCAIEPGRERLITPLPLVHMNALAVSTMAMLLSGGCVIQLDRFHPRSFWQTVRDSRATIVHYLGVMPAILLQLPESEADRSHRLKFGFGAGVHPKHHAAFERRFAFPLIESWSMTEVGGGAAIVANREPRHVGTRCFGRAGEALEYRIVADDGCDVAPGEAGELLVRRAGADPRKGFFSGYAGRPDLTEEAWAGGYFHTGDVVRTGLDGSFHFVDRKKSVIRRSGENISSLEVEAVLNQIETVGEVAVTPVEDELRGEEVMACVVLPPGHEASPGLAVAILEAARPHLAYYKLPGYIAFVPALPLTASNKLQRGTLRCLAEVAVHEGRAFDLRAGKKRPAHEGQPA